MFAFGYDIRMTTNTLSSEICDEEIDRKELVGEYPSAGDENVPVAEIHVIRRQRLNALLSDRFAGRQVDLAKALDRGTSYINQLLTGASQIGERFARHIETSLDLPKGWMDQYEGTMPYLSPGAVEFALKYESLTQEQRAALEGLMQAFGAAKKQDDAPPPAALKPHH